MSNVIYFVMNIQPKHLTKYNNDTAASSLKQHCAETGALMGHDLVLIVLHQDDDAGFVKCPVDLHLSYLHPLKHRSNPS